MEGQIDDQQAAEIIVAEELDSIRFRRDFVARNRPVLLRGGARGWPALRNWSHAELTRRCGEARVTLEFSSSGLFDPNTNTGRAAVEFCETTLAEALPILAHAHKSGAYYIRETPLVGDLFALRRDLGALPARPRFVRHFSPRIWIGSEGAASPLHYDGGDFNLLVHVAGRKQFNMYPPDDTENLYPNRAGRLPHLSLVDPLAPDTVRFPRYALARRSRLVLEPGDILFVPAWWWHSTLSTSSSISVNFWWQETWLSRLLYGRAAAPPEPSPAA